MLGIASVVLVVALGVVVFRLVAERSARRSVEASLRVFRRAVDNLPVEVTVKTLDGRVLYSNPAGRELHGYEIEETAGSPSRLAAPTALADSGEPDDGGTEARGAHGGELRSSVVRSGDGEPLVIVTAASEESGRKEQDREARRLRAALESAFEGIALVGEDQRLRGVSRAMADLFGSRADELEGRSARDLVLPGDASLLAHGFAQVEKTGKATEELRFRRADGIVFRGEAVLVRPRTDGGGREVHLFVRDVTTRAEREDALRASETKFRLLAETSPDAVLTVDDSGAIAFRNRRTEELFCYPGGTLGTRKLEELIAPESRERFAKALEEATTAGGSVLLGVEEELSAVRRNGSRFPVEISIAVVRARGAGRRVEDTARGVTRSVRIRDVSAQRMVRDLLVERVRSEERARALGDSTRELAVAGAAIGHDLREPLRKIRFFGDRLRAKHGALLPPEGLELLDRIGGAAARMQALVRDLEDWSEAGTHGPKDERVELSRVVAEVVSELAPRIAETEAEVVADGVLPAVACDEAEARQLVRNLVDNALRFRRDGVPPRIAISAHRFGDQVRLEVEDNGTGFDPAQTERIFGVFERLVGRDVPGSGVGLSICRKIARRHGGDVTATSTPGAGSRFVVTLPVAGIGAAARPSGVAA